MEPSTIVDIIGRMHGSWVGWDKLENVVIQPGKPAYTSDKYIIRVEPGMRDELIPVIEKELGESNRHRGSMGVAWQYSVLDCLYSPVSQQPAVHHGSRH